MSVRKIKIKNDQKFLDDLKKVSEVLVIAEKSNAYLPVTKQRVKQEAETEKIHYYLTRKIYKVGRLVMVIV
jgi:TolB-like protein